MMVAEMEAFPEGRPGPGKVLFRYAAELKYQDMVPDETGFLMLRDWEPTGDLDRISGIEVRLNWFEELQRLAAARR